MKQILNKMMDLNDATCIKKGWGRKGDSVGEFFAYHIDQEKDEHKIKVDTVKLLYMEKGKKLSRHFHKEKNEFFICVKGKFFVEFWIDEELSPISLVLTKEQRLFVPQYMQHRMTGLDEENILLEVSTRDAPEDSYRIEKGD
jgi:mannose-6-phosphate isomerase-like protein (cupin superfamily)